MPEISNIFKISEYFQKNMPGHRKEIPGHRIRNIWISDISDNRYDNIQPNLRARKSK